MSTAKTNTDTGSSLESPVGNLSRTFGRSCLAAALAWQNNTPPDTRSIVESTATGEHDVAP